MNGPLAPAVASSFDSLLSVRASHRAARSSRCYAGVNVFDEEANNEDPVNEVAEDEGDASVDESGDEGDETPSEEAARAQRIAAAKQRMEEEDAKEPAVVLPSPVCDAFSALVLELRASGHGILTGPSEGEDTQDDARASIEQVSSWSNPEPWSTFSGLNEYQVAASLGDVRRTLKSYAKVAAVPGGLSERLMGAVGAAWLQTVEAHATAEEGKQAAFVWGGGEKFAILLNDTCVHHLVHRDEPDQAGNRLVADTLMVLQDLATARVPLSKDAETVALAAVERFLAHVKSTDPVLDAAARLCNAAPQPSDAARSVKARGGNSLSGRTGYVKQSEGADGPRGRGRFDRGEGGGADAFYGRRDRFGDNRRGGFEQEKKEGDWDCPDCGFLNFARRTTCFKCGPQARPVRPFDTYGRENRDGRELREGDWKCPDCGFTNFASRTVCKRCTEGAGSFSGGYGGRGSFSAERRERGGRGRGGGRGYGGYSRGGYGGDRDDYRRDDGNSGGWDRDESGGFGGY